MNASAFLLLLLQLPFMLRCFFSISSVLLRPLWKLHWNKYDRTMAGWTFVFIRQMWAADMVNNYNLGIQQRRGSRMLVITSKGVVAAAWACRSCVCFFLHAPVHLKRISKGSFQYFQYCELEDFPFQHLHFITHVRACVLEGERGRKKESGGAKEKRRSRTGCLPESALLSTKGKWN